MRAPDTDSDRAAEGAKRAAEAGLQLLLWLLLLLLIVLLLGGALLRPTRREILIRHLESPTIRVAPSRRVENLWRRAVIALHDVGLPSSPAEPASTLAQRAVSELQQRYGEAPPGLTEAAAIYTRIHYNLGIGPDDDREMASNVNRFTRFLGERTDVVAKIRNYYRSLPGWD
jgi:hypothetical protein